MAHIQFFSDLQHSWKKSSGSLLFSLLTLFLFDTSVASAKQVASKILTTEGKVTFSPPGKSWKVAKPDQLLHVNERLRTGEFSRASFRLTDLSVIRIDEFTTVTMKPPAKKATKAGLNLKQGALYFFGREKPQSINVDTPISSGSLRGTEFAIHVATSGLTTYTLYDGVLELENEFGQLTLKSGEQARIEPGSPPRKTAVIDANKQIQWCLYYPVVLLPEDLKFNVEEQSRLAENLKIYKSGNILAALDHYPSVASPAKSPSEKLYAASLLLGAGKVEKANNELASLSTTGHAADLKQALTLLIASVAEDNSNEIESPIPNTASQWMAASYFAQSTGALDAALYAAEKATKAAPQSGFAWERVAELSFGFGDIRTTDDALKKALLYSPQHAQAYALQAFIDLAKNDIDNALHNSQKAIDIDGALGNAWLARGLCRMNKGEYDEGLGDLQVASTLEPKRSLLRSYLAKAFANSGNTDIALKELKRATTLDPNDPTPPLYASLILRQNNEINQAVRSLNQSIRLNDNRGIYRSRFLLDQDQSIRSANLALTYQDAGLQEVSVREAAKAVSYDYSNYAAHLFLSNTFDALRDPNRINLRYETPWFNELLLANLLAPSGIGTISQGVSQQEYTRLFDTKKMAGLSLSEYQANGRFRQLFSFEAQSGGTSYSVDIDYQNNDGVRTNNEVDRIEWYTQIKHQLNERDSIFFLTKYQDYEVGDVLQYHDPSQARPNFFFEEQQEPIAFAAFHREWSPGNHTLALVGRLVNEQQLGDLQAQQLVLTKNPLGQVTAVSGVPLDVDYQSDFEIYTAEINQILENDRYFLIFGARYQTGEFETNNRLDGIAPALAPFFPTPPANASIDNDLERSTAYSYLTWKGIDKLLLTGGVTYDNITFPQNFRSPPVSQGEDKREQISPKLAAIWTPNANTTIRTIYAQTLGGVSYDESFRLEPTQLAGFNQAFRSLIPESVAGSVAAPKYEIFGGAIDLQFDNNTYFGVTIDNINTKVPRNTGVFDFNGFTSTTSTTKEKLFFEETSILIYAGKLISNEWSCGLSYRFSEAELDRKFSNIPDSVFPDVNDKARLHHWSSHLLYNHRQGFFGQLEINAYQQDNLEASSSLKDDSFYQANILTGYRFWQRRAELTLGLLNVTDEDYALNPLNFLTTDLPRERTLYIRAKFQF